MNPSADCGPRPFPLLACSGHILDISSSEAGSEGPGDDPDVVVVMDSGILEHSLAAVGGDAANANEASGTPESRSHSASATSGSTAGSDGRSDDSDEVREHSLAAAGNVAAHANETSGTPESYSHSASAISADDSSSESSTSHWGQYEESVKAFVIAARGIGWELSEHQVGPPFSPLPSSSEEEVGSDTSSVPSVGPFHSARDALITAARRIGWIVSPRQLAPPWPR